MKARQIQPEPQREYRISGTYKTTRDEGLDYTYSATWEIESLGLAWSAEVSRNGKVVGRPRGIFWHNDVDHAAHLHRVIGRYIENCWLDEK
jgi:hypothetical protein